MAGEDTSQRGEVHIPPMFGVLTEHLLNDKNVNGW
jgi:hypothetical protein